MGDRDLLAIPNVAAQVSRVQASPCLARTRRKWTIQRLTFTPIQKETPMQRLPDTSVEAVFYSQDESVMTTGDWFVTQLLLAIPIVNIILLLVWGFSSSGNHNRRNFARATMVWVVIAFVLFVFIALVSNVG